MDNDVISTHVDLWSQALLSLADDINGVNTATYPTSPWVISGSHPVDIGSKLVASSKSLASFMTAVYFDMEHCESMYKETEQDANKRRRTGVSECAKLISDWSFPLVVKTCIGLIGSVLDPPTAFRVKASMKAAAHHFSNPERSPGLWKNDDNGDVDGDGDGDGDGQGNHVADNRAESLCGMICEMMENELDCNTMNQKASNAACRCRRMKIAVDVSQLESTIQGHKFAICRDEQCDGLCSLTNNITRAFCVEVCRKNATVHTINSAWSIFAAIYRALQSSSSALDTAVLFSDTIRIYTKLLEELVPAVTCRFDSEWARFQSEFSQAVQSVEGMFIANSSRVPLELIPLYISAAIVFSQNSIPESLSKLNDGFRKRMQHQSLHSLENVLEMIEFCDHFLTTYESRPAVIDRLEVPEYVNNLCQWFLYRSEKWSRVVFMDPLLKSRVSKLLESMRRHASSVRNKSGDLGTVRDLEFLKSMLRMELMTSLYPSKEIAVHLWTDFSSWSQKQDGKSGGSEAGESDALVSFLDAVLATLAELSGSVVRPIGYDRVLNLVATLVAMQGNSGRTIFNGWTKEHMTQSPEFVLDMTHLVGDPVSPQLKDLSPKDAAIASASVGAQLHLRSCLVKYRGMFVFPDIVLRDLFTSFGQLKSKDPLFETSFYLLVLSQAASRDASFLASCSSVALSDLASNKWTCEGIQILQFDNDLWMRKNDRLLVCAILSIVHSALSRTRAASLRLQSIVEPSVQVSKMGMPADLNLMRLCRTRMAKSAVAVISELEETPRYKNMKIRLKNVKETLLDMVAGQSMVDGEWEAYFLSMDKRAVDCVRT